jgi:RND family efflux transporter MFP subunit
MERCMMWFARLGFVVAVVAAAITPAQAAGSLEHETLRVVEVPREYRLDGVVEAVNQSTVSAQTSGQVEEILFDVDDFVETGNLIVRLKDTEQKARLVQAEAQLKAARSQLESARDEFERTGKMHAKQLVSDAAMDKATAARDTAAAQVEAAVAAAEQAREQLAYTQIRAPYTGIVTHRHVQAGEMAAPGQPLMSGISLDEMRVTVDVPQSLIPLVREINVAHVQEPGDGWVQAKKITIFPFADHGSNTFKVRLDLPRGVKNLFPGMFVKTAFLTGATQELVVPREAVVRRSEVTGVYVVDATGAPSLRYVRLGRELPDGFTIVLSGLEPGEQVALDPVAAGVMIKRGMPDGEKERVDG